MSSIELIIQTRSSFWTELNYSIVRFDIDFVTDNVINANIDGVAISPVTYTTNQLTTINSIISSINNTGIARAEIYISDSATRSIKIHGLNSSSINVSEVVVTGGLSQAVATITASRYSDLLTLARSTVGTVFNACGKTNYAIALVIMHWLSLEEQSGGTGNAQSGSIKSKREGDLSITYGSSSSGSNSINPYWGQTAYGLEYINLKKSCIMGARNRMIGAFCL